MPLPVTHFEGFEPAFKRFVQAFLEKDSRGAQENDFQVAFFAGIPVPLFFHLFTPGLDLLDFVYDENTLFLPMEVHFHPGLLPAGRYPGGIFAIDAIGSKEVVRSVNTIDILPDKGGFAHLTRPHDDLHTSSGLGHPAL